MTAQEQTQGTEVLTAMACQLLANPTNALAESYHETKCLQLDGFVRSEVLEAIVTAVLPAVRPYASRLLRPHHIEAAVMWGGRRQYRIDPGRYGGDLHDTPEKKRAIRQAFDTAGLTEFSRRLFNQTGPLLERIVHRRLDYDRCFLLTYDEGDFIAPHGDTQTSERLLVQVPVLYGCASALRVLVGGWMEPFYDLPGTLRIMGPGIWHEVTPVLRVGDAERVERVILTLRLPYAKDT